MNNFAILDIWYTHFETDLVIRVLTNNPCHLTCYHTNKPPLKHARSRTIRGLTMPWGVYFCFVAYTGVEQDEAGDVYCHTFQIPNWQPAEARYFVFQGSVGAYVSPSTSPIFIHIAPAGLPRDIIIRPNAPGASCRIRREVGAPCPNHYLNVDDIIPDEDASYVYETLYQYQRTDLYNLEDPPPTLGVIDSVTISARFKRRGGYAYAIDFWTKLLTHSTLYHEKYSYFGTNWSTMNWTLTTNPFTGNPWTISEVYDLQAGIGLEYYHGIGWSSVGCCTQVYVTIRRGIIGCTP